MAKGANSVDPEVERLRRSISELSAANVALQRENEEWRRAEQALRKREVESALIMDNIPNLVSLLAPSGAPERINRQILEYTGKTEDELHGWGGSDLVHPEDRSLATDCFRAGIQSGDPFGITYRMRRFDGAHRWFHARHRPLKDPDGHVVRWCVAVNDIDDMKRAEEALRESEQSSRSLIDGIPGCVATLTPGGDVEVVNRQILEYTGQPLEGLKRWGTNGIVHPEDMPHVAGIFIKSITAGTPYEIEQRLRRHDGAYRWFSNRGTPALDAAGGIVRWYVLLVDIDEARQAQEALRESEREARRAEDALRASEGSLLKIINTLPTTAWSTRPDGYCDFLNQRWLDYAGFTAEQAEGSGWAAVIHSDDRSRLSEHWQACLASGIPMDTEARMRRFDGVYRWFLFRANPLRNEGGTIIKWYGTNIDVEDRKRADELRQSELQSRLMVSSVPALIATFAPDGALEGANEQFLRYLGQTIEEARRWTTNGTAHPDDLFASVEVFSRSLASGEPYEFEARMRRFDGAYRWFQVRGNPARDADGRIVRWYGLLTDIDDRKRAEEALQASEVNLLKIINTLPTTAWSTRPDGYCDFLSSRWLDYAGFTAEQAEGWGWGAVIHPDDMGGLVERWRAGLASGMPVDAEARMRRFDGVFRWFLFRANPLRDEHGTVIKWYGTNIDIEDHKRVDALRQSELQSRLIVNTIPGFVALFSPEGALNGANEQFLGYMGLTVEEAGKWATNGAVHLDDLANTGEAFSRSLASGHPYDFESRIRGSDGTYRWFQIRGNPARDAEGRIVRWYGLLTDIDDRKRAEEHRRRAEEALSGLRSELAHISRVSSLGVLTASVAHEVNQPLAGIITNTSTCLRMLAASPPNVEGALETVRRTMRDGARASEVVGRLRALFSKQTAKSEEVDLNEAAAEVIPLASGDLQRNRVVLRTDFANQLPRFTADRVQLQQVILNLLLNASDAMKGIDDRQRLAVIRTAPDGDGVRFSVEDVGVGIATEDLERLFQAFYTTKSSGMGIGLSVSRSIIESHNGRIWGEPNDGPGATFSFFIPVGLKTTPATA